MQLSNLFLSSFRNHHSANYDFSSGINVFWGPNGRGKTNLLEAIYYICFGKSPIHVQEKVVFSSGSQAFSLSGLFIKDDQKNRVRMQVGRVGPKRIWINDSTCLGRSGYVGKFPAIWISPKEMDIIKGGNEKRRRFFDTTLSQIYPDYLKALIKYQRYLRHRHAALQSLDFDADCIDNYDVHLIPLAQNLARYRRDFLQTYLPLFQKTYGILSQSPQESVSICYETEVLDQDYPQNYKKNLDTDRALKRTTKGIHKDKFHWSMNQERLETYASEGQQKTFLLSLKLSAYLLISKRIETLPILLLDDILDTLDEKRRHHLFVQIQEIAGQTFITGSSQEAFLVHLPEGTKFFRI
ncbi:MAG: DNA replication and repair protein RecF [Cytophagales bacterium]|nr:DNA replication and repair protein RecF [Cytophagales bacterium]